MKPNDWRGVAELIGIAAIVGSLIFVGLQMQQDQDIAIAESYGSSIESLANIASLIDANPELWNKGLDGEELSVGEEIKFLALVRVVEDHFFNMTNRFERLNIGEVRTFPRRYAFAVYMHPGLRGAFMIHREFNSTLDGSFDFQGTPNPLLDQVYTLLLELDERRPPLPDEKTYVFW